MDMSLAIRHTLRFGGLTLLAVILAGCARAPSFTNIDPWIDRDGEIPAVAVCYSEAETTREQVMAFALAGCPEEQRALTLLDEDSVLNNCPLVKRNRITFACVAPGTEGQLFP